MLIPNKRPSPEVIKLFILNSAEPEIYPAHKCQNDNNCCCHLTFIGMINTTSERLKARHFYICRYFSFYEQLKFRARLFQKKYLGGGGGGGGRRQTIYFYMGGWCGHFSNHMGHWCLKKSDYMGGWVLSKSRLLTFDRYIKWNVAVSIKISNTNLPVVLLCEIIQSTHKLIYFV